MSIDHFFTDTLRANLRNARWSWGAFDPKTNRVFLRVWEHEIETVPDGERILVALDKPRRNSDGFPERHDHLDWIQKGAEGFGVVCTAADPDTDGVRKIKSFDDSTLLRLGRLTKENGRMYARIDARVPVADVIWQRTNECMLTADLQTLTKQKIDSTTKDALIKARLGQGSFRSQVLEIWGHQCSVTGSETLDVIRASHIKPWRTSTNEERLDPKNGIALVASLDALFDSGLIAFEASGRLIVSSMLNATEQKIFGIKDASLSTAPAEETAKYLAYHRRNIFRK
jgi:putative restriction endonuclease